jgi:hypothetical protein
MRGNRQIMRRYSFSLGGLALGCAVAQAACSSSSGGSGNNVQCGPGTALDASVCYVSSGGGETVEGGVDGSNPGDDGGAQTSGITFAGALAAAPASTTALFVTWGAASSAALPDGGGAFTYRVYVANAPGQENFAVPTVVSAPGATSVVIDNGLTASTKYYVVVRAVDAAGREDTNTVEQSATLQADITSPLFAGVTSVTPAPEAGLTIAWAPATDDLTPAAALVYDIYLSPTAGGENLNLPNAVSLPGAMSITVAGLSLASTTYYVVVRAVDAAGNVDLSPESVIELSGKTGTDDVAPVFGGCSSATQVDAQSIAVTWQGATDNSTPAVQIAYDVFAATTEGGQDFTHPSKTFVASGSDVLTGGLVDGLKSGTTYYLVCRARDLSSNEDQNTFARVATTAIDSVPPMFAGVTGVRNITPTTVDLYWSAPATDDQTPTSQIVYLAYQATAAGGEMLGDAGAPVATSDPGATSMTISGLKPATTYYWVVRAQDRAGNTEQDTHETTATTQVSFSQNVVGVLGTHCAITGCHIPGSPPNGLIMTPSQAYQNLVGVTVVESPNYLRVDPSNAADSYIYLKVSSASPPVGTRMPPPATDDVLSAAEIKIIQDWINQGALQN